MCRIALLFVPLFALAQPPAGRDLSLAEAQRLEDSLQKNPDDTTAHTTLLAYYFRNGLRDMAPEKVKEARRRHILWLIEHHPEDRLAGAPEARVDLVGGSLADPEGYVQAAAAWRKEAAKPEASSALLTNAAHFFTLTENEFAASLLVRALGPSQGPGRGQKSGAQLPDAGAPGEGRSRQGGTRKKGLRANGVGSQAGHQTGGAVLLVGRPRQDGARRWRSSEGPGLCHGVARMAPQFPKNCNYGNAIHDGNLVPGGSPCGVEISKRPRSISRPPARLPAPRRSNPSAPTWPWRWNYFRKGNATRSSNTSSGAASSGKWTEASWTSGRRRFAAAVSPTSGPTCSIEPALTLQPAPRHSGLSSSGIRA